MRFSAYQTWCCIVQGILKEIRIPGFSFESEAWLQFHQGPTHVEDSEEEINDESTTAKDPRAAPPTLSKPGKQKKRKGKKVKGDPAERAEPPAAAEGEEDLDKLLSELNIQLVSALRLTCRADLYHPYRSLLPTLLSA